MAKTHRFPPKSLPTTWSRRNTRSSAHLRDSRRVTLQNISVDLASP